MSDKFIDLFPRVAVLRDGLNAVKYRAGNKLIPGHVRKVGDELEFIVGFNRYVIDELKMLAERKWNGLAENPHPRKTWSAPLNHRNMFALEYLFGGDPYQMFKSVYPPYESPFGRPLKDHQKMLVSMGITNHFCLYGADMGTGKTLCAIELADWIHTNKFALNRENAFFCGCKSALVSVEIELGVWQSQVNFSLFTYEKLIAEIKNWPAGKPAPRLAIFDESSHLKNATAQRAQSAKYLADAMRKEWGNDCYIIEMTGTPAPRTPENWWHQCEILAPGYVREPSPAVFKSRFCLIEQRESLAGTSYPHLITYFDDEKKCKICGEYPEHNNHKMGGHTYVPSVNEVAALYHRLKGLVAIVKKEDCLDLPDKLFEVRKVRPTTDMLMAADAIKKTAPRAITALNQLRQISDGFQYVDEEVEQITCGFCGGKGIVPVDSTSDQGEFDTEYGQPDDTCHVCAGSGTVPKYERQVKFVGTPKDAALLELLEEYEECGRFVVWCAYTATLDHVVDMVKKQGWTVLRVDGRGYHAETPTGEVVDADIMLDAMRNNSKNRDALYRAYPRVCFVGNPEAGGMGLTLHASPIAVYFSNTFSGSARMQSEDRIHRLGMDSNRAARIIDFVLLPTDALVIRNLRNKKRLQDLTMRELQEIAP